MVRVRRNLDENSARYQKFGTRGVSNTSDTELLHMLRRVIRVARLYQDDLEGTGLDEKVLAEINDLANEFESALNQQDDAIADRDIATDDRALMANGIYEDVKAICETGRTIWRHKNEAKFNDYVIYDTPSGKPEPEVNEETTR
jgi:hypothetical protein